tara:strand:- start:558 stop:1529 length:972 start_codon:yes stop_codon:yes gene_type:complete
MNILITGCAGFIGYHTCEALLKNRKIKIYGIDNLNDYYDVNLKKNRLKILKKRKNFKFNKSNIIYFSNLEKIFKKNKFDIVIHLAAQAGVRYSIKKPTNYFNSNIKGFFNILLLVKKFKTKHFLFASTSSVYGLNKKFPLSEKLATETPLSFYAASKKTNESMAHSFCNIYNTPITCLRFFTVYGEYGRPDMSLHKFVSNILNNKKINLFNNGNHERDFTYVKDVVEVIKKIMMKPSRAKIPYQVFNVASGKPKKLKYFLKVIEQKLNKKSQIQYLDLQPGDIIKTHGDINAINKVIGYKPSTSFELGIDKFIKWFKAYYNLK